MSFHIPMTQPEGFNTSVAPNRFFTGSNEHRPSAEYEHHGKNVFKQNIFMVLPQFITVQESRVGAYPI